MSTVNREHKVELRYRKCYSVLSIVGEFDYIESCTTERNIFVDVSVDRIVGRLDRRESPDDGQIYPVR